MKTETVAHTTGPWAEAEGARDSEFNFIMAKGKVICEIDISHPENKANAALIAAAPELLEAVKATDIYFKTLCEQWAANDGRLISDEGIVIEAARDVRRLCEIASEKVLKALAHAEGRAE